MRCGVFGAGPRGRDHGRCSPAADVARVPTLSRLQRPFVPVREWAHPGQLRGLWGERVALAYLTACGWAIEAHRFRFGRHDVDLIARRGSLVAFVEVKTRRSQVCGAPLEAVGWQKRRAIARAAECWRLRFGRRGDCYRFDLLTVRVDADKVVSVDHVQDAWRLER
jgi:putative endonuclease